jgi:hypothetical protein
MTVGVIQFHGKKNSELYLKIIATNVVHITTKVHNEYNNKEL